MRRTVQKRLTAVISVIAFLPVSALPAVAEAAQVQLNETVSTRGGTVTGTVWRLDNSPVPDAALQLRDVTSGLVVRSTRGDQAGRFTFLRVNAGSYIVELVDDDRNVLALGQMFSLGPTETVATFIRLGASGARWSGGFLSNAAAAALAAAAAAGVTAIGHGGQPASGRS